MSSAPKDVSRRHLITGKKGETLALRYLKKEGFRIITQNYRNRIGEIDIIAQEGEVLVFIEVKTRSGDDFGAPQAAVDYRKQLKISQVALSYLSEKGLMSCCCRFDVVAIRTGMKAKQVELIRNAFEMTI